MAYISDDTTVTSRQTPLFIQQASNTEVFCDVSEDLTKVILGTEVTQGDTEEDDQGQQDIPPDIPFERKLIEVIRADAAEYCSEEEATFSLNMLIKTISDYSFNSIISELYNVQAVPQGSYVGFTGLKSVGKWLSEEKGPYFAKVTYRQEEYEAKEKVEIEDDYPSYLGSTIRMARMLGAQRKFEYKTVTRYRDVIDGIELTSPSPCTSIDITFSPKEQNLPWHKAFILFVFSKSSIVIFYKNEEEKEISWNQRETLNFQEWKKIRCGLKNSDLVKDTAIKIMTSIEESLVSELAAAFGV